MLSWAHTRSLCVGRRGMKTPAGRVVLPALALCPERHLNFFFKQHHKYQTSITTTKLRSPCPFMVTCTVVPHTKGTARYKQSLIKLLNHKPSQINTFSKVRVVTSIFPWVSSCWPPSTPRQHWPDTELRRRNIHICIFGQKYEVNINSATNHVGGPLPARARAAGEAAPVAAALT